MKRNIFAFTCILILHECAYAQQDTVLYFSAIINTPDAKPNNNRSNISELNKIFDRNKVLNYETSLSSIRHPEKETKVEISCNNCDSESFINELTAKGYFKDITYYEATPDYEPNDYMWYLGWLWHLNKIKADNAWDITKSNDEVRIAVIDTDFDINHPDLTNKINPHYDPQTLITHSASGSSHGTATSSFAGAETDGGGQLASIGFNTRIIAYKITTNLVAQAYHATFSMDADIISFSFSGSSYTSPRDREDIKEILDSGTIIVRSAGNQQTDSDNNRHPFADDVDQRIIIVSSTDIDDNHTYLINPANTHANYPEVDLCAPGYCVMGASPTVDSSGQPVSWPYNGYQTGTSFATPIVAGVCALMKSINPCLTPSEAETIIKETADPITDANLFPGIVGAGRINAYNSVKMAGTRNFSNTSLSGNQNLSAGYGFNFTNVTIGSNSNISLLARKEVNLNGTLVVPLGSSFSVEMDENVQNNCP